MVSCMKNMNERMEILKGIKGTLHDVFGAELKSAIVYGSTLNADFCEVSDYDILLIFKEIPYNTLTKIRDVKEAYKKHSIGIDFNTHVISDLPHTRGILYWHNNRSAFIQKELAMSGVAIIGENPFLDYEVEQNEMQIETVRMLNSFAYQARKMLINKDLQKNENRIFMIKWCIYGALYLLAGEGYYFKNRKEGLECFPKVFDTHINPVEFLNIKVCHAIDISINDIERAYEFLSFLDYKAIKLYQHLDSHVLTA